jgi:hypothetical protein
LHGGFDVLCAGFLRVSAYILLGFQVGWDEFSAKNRFEGNTFLITIGYIIKSLEKKEEKG